MIIPKSQSNGLLSITLADKDDIIKKARKHSATYESHFNEFSIALEECKDFHINKVYFKEVTYTKGYLGKKREVKAFEYYCGSGIPKTDTPEGKELVERTGGAIQGGGTSKRSRVEEGTKGYDFFNKEMNSIDDNKEHKEKLLKEERLKEDKGAKALYKKYDEEGWPDGLEPPDGYIE